MMNFLGHLRHGVSWDIQADSSLILEHLGQLGQLRQRMLLQVVVCNVLHKTGVNRFVVRREGMGQAGEGFASY